MVMHRISNTYFNKRKTLRSDFRSIYRSFNSPRSNSPVMNTSVYVGLLLFSVTVAATAYPTVDHSSLSGFLTYLDTRIHQVQGLLSQPRSTHPGPVDCSQIQNEARSSGEYRIWPLNWETIGSFKVYCDMETDGGGWTVIQRRGDYKKPVDYFYKNWKEYQSGFGNLTEDFWLGNDKIYGITNQGNYSLRIDMQDKEGEKRFASYQEFWIESERQGYQLHVSGYTGDAGDSFSDLDGMKFTTKDVDNDPRNGNCALLYKGGWWYRQCHWSNLNGLYHNGYHKSFADGINWHSWRGYNYSLPVVDMKIKKN